MSASIKMLSLDDLSISHSLDRAGYRKMGVQVDYVGSFAEAQKALGSKRFDLVVINLDVLELDGLSICASLKNHKTWNKIPVVVTSVISASKLQNRVLQAGADLFVEQPLPRNFFIEKIKSLLNHEVRESPRVGQESLGSAEISLDTKKNEKKEKKFYQTVQIGDISPTGILVYSKELIPEKTTLQLNFKLPHIGTKLKIEGQVVRKVEQGVEASKGHAFGIRFTHFFDDAEEILSGYVAKYNLDDKQLLYYL